jgi:hypothetical protein
VYIREERREGEKLLARGGILENEWLLVVYSYALIPQEELRPPWN